jgi:hypothetical protein
MSAGWNIVWVKLRNQADPAGELFDAAFAQAWPLQLREVVQHAEAPAGRSFRFSRDG